MAFLSRIITFGSRQICLFLFILPSEIQGVVRIKWEEIQEHVNWEPKEHSLSRTKPDYPCRALIRRDKDGK